VGREGGQERRMEGMEEGEKKGRREERAGEKERRGEEYDTCARACWSERTIAFISAGAMTSSFILS
jgi:hypothetical protein